jgi:shikimate dehydrogenase
VGLIGAGIATSLSPALHEREAAMFGLRYFYHLIDLEQLGVREEAIGELVRAARKLGFRGLNVTHPCKQRVIEHLDQLDVSAARVGAVNTVLFENGLAIGHNTDLHGFEEGFRRGLPGAALDRVVVVGAGGAGAAVADALRALGVRTLTLVDVDRGRADALATHLDVVAADPSALADLLERADGLVNATPIGMEGHPGIPVPAELLRRELWVADVIYRPLETELLRQARLAGCRTLDGGRMVVFQAAQALSIFTGLEPDGDRMLDHFRELTCAGR